MTPKGFGYTDKEVLDDIHIPSEYIAHPTNIDEYKELEKEIAGYIRPEYFSAKYDHTTIVSVGDFKLRKNVGRKKGNDAKVYSVIEKNLERGYKRGKLPPIVLKREDGKLEDWLVNGNHRWLWYCNNGHSYMIVDVYKTREGFDVEDVVDEIGLLCQPQPDGTSSSKDDYIIRGRSWVSRRVEAQIPTTQQDVDVWVDKFAMNESSRTRTDIKKQVFNRSVKNEFLTNYSRPNVIRFYNDCNITILDSGAQITGTRVYRLFEASQEVFIRDFWPTFLENAGNKITTVLNFYVNTSNIDSADGIQICINNRIKTLNEMFNNLDRVLEGSGTELRKYLIFGTRPPQIVDVDDYNKPVKYEVNFDAPAKGKKLWQMTLNLLKQNFDKGIAFNFDQASNIVYPIRQTVSNFKSKKSFNGTLLGELQKLRDLKYISFNAQKGWYTLL
jgi:hypothetical protein